jgi:hypothetical protein
MQPRNTTLGIAENVIGNTAPRQDKYRMGKWKILKSPHPKKPAVHGGLREEV